MNIPIKAARLIHHSPDKIYQLLLALPSLAMDFPIVEEVTQLKEHEYRVKIFLDYQVYSGSYEAILKLTNLEEDKNVGFSGQHASRWAKLKINGDMSLVPEEGSTLVTLNGDFQVKGMMRFAGKKIIGEGVTVGVRYMFDWLEGKLDESVT